MLIQRDPFLPIDAPFAVTFGKFDGFHIGHGALFDALGALPPGVLRVAYLLEGKIAKHERLLSREDCFALAQAWGVDIVRHITLDPAFSALSPEGFVAALAACGPLEHIVVGADFHFGKNAAGNAALLEALSPAYGYTLEIVPPVMLEGQPVGSTRIRQALREGRVNAAWAMLGRPHTIKGVVIPGRGRGASLGFATANLPLPEDILAPAPGVYCGWAYLDDMLRQALINVGDNPTFSGDTARIETHIIGIDGPQYGKLLRVHFARRLRGELRFSSVEALIEQIAQDKADGLEVLSGLTFTSLPSMLE